MTRQTVSFHTSAALLLGAFVWLAGSSAEARDLTVVGWGGQVQEKLREVYFTPYAQKTGQKVLDDTWDGGVGILRTKTANGDGGWDVVQVESEELELGCAEGLFLKIDYAKLGGKARRKSQQKHNAVSFTHNRFFVVLMRFVMSFVTMFTHSFSLP